MKIQSITVDIQPHSGEDASPLTIRLVNGAEWSCEGRMWPRDIRFMAALESFVREYNANTPKKAQQ